MLDQVNNKIWSEYTNKGMRTVLSMPEMTYIKINIPRHRNCKHEIAAMN